MKDHAQIENVKLNKFYQHLFGDINKTLYKKFVYNMIFCNASKYYYMSKVEGKDIC